MKIKEMNANEKPRERLKKYGVENLSNEELIAIIISSGTKNSSSKELALKIINKYEGISNLKDASINSLNEIKGMGIAKSSQILSALELGKRVYYIKESLNKKIKNTSDVYELYKSEFAYLKQEKFCALYLDTKNCIISFKTIFQGTLDSSTVHPREIFKEAIKLSANKIICIHNHPSGNVMPSVPDIEITNMLISSGKMLGIQIIDHIIFGNNEFYSFYESNHKNK